MAEYIDREELLTHQYNASHSNWPQLAEMVVGVEDIEDAPAADVAPVVHGRWECVYDDGMGETDITCSHCKNTRTVNGCFVSTDGKSCYFEDDYCPNCGAKMDLEVE